MNPPAKHWKSLIRFEDEEGKIYVGEPLDGLYTKATVAVGTDILNVQLTDQVKSVAKLLAPYEPETILCIGLNYQDHAREAKFPIPPYPIVFHKSKNAVTGPTSAIPIPSHCKSIDYENELCVVLSKPAKNVPAAEVLSEGYILAYAIGNDVSARDWQKRDISGGQFCYAKSFDAFLPLGPALVHPNSLEKDAANLKIVTRHNGEVVQNSSTQQMIFGVPELVEFLTKGTTLPAGTLIMTGTPHGVAAFRKDPPVFIKAGDVIECEIEGLGCLTNKFSAE